MVDIKYSGWNFNVDVESTMEYYKNYDGLCDCAMCRNFYLNAPNLPSDVKNFLEQFGIDVGKPIEQWSVIADKQEKIVENALYYAVNGTAESLDGYEIDFGAINVVVQAPKPDDVVKCPENSPNTEISEPYFILEVYNVWTPWLVEDDINACYPDPKPKKVLAVPLFIISLLLLSGAAFAGIYAFKNDSILDKVLLFVAAILLIFVGGIILFILMIPLLHIGKKKDKPLDSFNTIWECDYDDIWNIGERNSLVIAMNGWLCRKCNYGENIDKLTDAEKALYLVIQLEGEVNNGGFSQFLYNSSGDFANETPAALLKIGAEKTAEICDRVLAAFGGLVSRNREERETFLDNAFTDEINEILIQCDKDFFEQPDDLELLNYQFIFKNKDQFTRM
ncbi:MAG: DMP19 family protein [Oscillospiraceae bacterium]|nr:DMP19 family protein [Oscillospiraceae bacterium]